MAKKLIPFLFLVPPLFFVSYSLAAEVHFQWGASSGVVDGYRIYCGSAHQGPYPNLLVQVGGTTTDCYATLDEGVTYYLVMRAYNNYGESGNSNEVMWPSGPPRKVAPPEIRVFGNNDTEGVIHVPADGHISVHASVLPGDYQEAVGDVYVLLVVSEMQLAFWLNDDGRWDSAIVPYRSNAQVGSIAALSIFENVSAGVIPPGEYQFYVGLQLPFDHDCDGAYDLYYSMLRVIVENHSPVIDD